jgi:AAA+ ATPase superfamily predicted ATPase
MFVNRVSELECWKKRYASGKAEFFVLYGRRRVGKTELLARFCEVSARYFLYQTWVQKYRLERLYPLPSI